MARMNGSESANTSAMTDQGSPFPTRRLNCLATWLSSMTPVRAVRPNRRGAIRRRRMYRVRIDMPLQFIFVAMPSHHRPLVGLAGSAVAASLLLVACTGSAPPPGREFDGPAAFRYLEQQVAFGPRVPGTPAHARQAAWLDSLLKVRADTVIVQRWTHTTVKGDTLPLVNYIARFNPKATTRILLAAHWDSRPHTDNPVSTDSSKYVPGANDGASGVATLLGIADALKKVPPQIGVDLLFDDGEDWGNFDKEPNDVLIGVRYYAQHLPPGPLPVFAAVTDMIGDKDLKICKEGNSMTAAPDVVEHVWDVAKQMGYSAIFGACDTSIIDDHLELQKVGIKAIDLIDFDYGPSPNRWWHSVDDTPDKLSPASIKAVGDVLIGVIRVQPTAP